MKKYCWRVFLFIGISITGYTIFKFVKVLKAVLSLEEVLPNYLDNLYDCKPLINISMTFKRISISVNFTEDEIIESNDVKKHVIDYVNDFYPVINLGHLDVEVRSYKV